MQADPAEDDDEERWDTASMTHDQRQKRKQQEMHEEAPERKRPVRKLQSAQATKGAPPSGSGSVSAILNQNKEYPTLEQTWRKAQQEYLVKMATKLAEAESFLHGGLESACLSFTGPGLHCPALCPKLVLSLLVLKPC